MKEALTSTQRVEAALALRPTDRAVLGHSIDSFAARYAGITQEDWWFDHDKANAALVKAYQDLGPWDTMVGFAPGHPLAFVLSAPMRVKQPGRDLPPDAQMQFEELELMKAEDYDLIVERGFDAFLEGFFPRQHIPLDAVQVAMAQITRHGIADDRQWTAMGVHILCAAKLRPPYDWFSYARSLQPFMLDLFQRPDRVIAAMDATLPAMLKATKAKMAGIGSRGVFVPMARGSATFVSPRQFERFCFPWLKRLADELVADGCVPVLHCDSNWGPYLHYLRELPKQKCILQLDEQTDIFEAKQVLGDHMCIMGNVASALLSLGSAQEVEAHCRSLIEVVGAGGGFILGPACTMPVDANPDNVRAMTRAVLGA